MTELKKPHGTAIRLSKYAILYVDDEEKSLKGFARAFGDDFRIYTATNAKDGAKLIEEKKDEIAVLMTDQKMPGENGNWLLQETARKSAADRPHPRHRLR
jgi:YesN/AraC family two-component response regulator